MRKEDRHTLVPAIVIAKRCEKAALLSGRWAGKKKKTRFEESDESDDDSLEEDRASPPSSKAELPCQI